MIASVTVRDVVSARVKPVVGQLAGGLIVSCQAYPGEPLHRPGIMPLMAVSAERGGAVAVRLEGIDDVKDAVNLVGVPVIGIVKRGVDGVCITPTLDDALALVEAGADVVALDGTRRPRPDGYTLAQVVTAIRQASDVVIMADCGSVNDARAAFDARVDLVATTLAGLTGERHMTDGPDIDLIRQIASHLPVPVIAEGRIQTREHIRAARQAGAYAVCVGSAITHPERTTHYLAA